MGNVEEVQPLVCDNGSGMVKVYLCCDDQVIIGTMPKTEVKSPVLSPSAGGTPQQQQQQQQQQTLPMQQNSQQQQAQQPITTQAATGNTAPLPGPNASGEGRRISCEDIQLVQNLIERCLQLYMNRTEVISTLLSQAKIEPGFTGLVWQKLEEQNPDFFKAYYVRLTLKKQITLFNHFLEQHAQLTQKMHPAKAPLPALQNGLHTPAVHHLPIGYPVPQQPPMVAANHPHIAPMPVASLTTPVMGGAPIAEGFVAAHGSPGSNNLNPDMSLLPTTSSPNAVLQGSSTFLFTGMGNPTDMPGMGMDVRANFPPDAPFHSTENPTQNGMGSLQITTDADAGGGRESIGLLSHLPRNFSLSDLTAELSNSTDILGSYIGSPFLAPDADVFIRSSDDEKMLDQIADPSDYDDFEDEK